MVAYPPAPWRMHGSMWLTVFRLGRDIDGTHPAGIYGAALVDYREPSPLTYGELLVARRVSRRSLTLPGRSAATGSTNGSGAVTITDIWVDSPASMAGGRELWAIPKDLCDFDLESESKGPLTTTRWRATAERKQIVEAQFTDVSRVAPRMPFKGNVEQPGIPDHPEVAHVLMKGSARALPCRAKWQFTADGPLGFLNEARQLGSFRMIDFRLHFE